MIIFPAFSCILGVIGYLGSSLALASQLLPMPMSIDKTCIWTPTLLRVDYVTIRRAETITILQILNFFPFHPRTDRRYWDGTKKFSTIYNQTALRDRINHASSFIGICITKTFFKEPNANLLTEHKRSIHISTRGISL